MHRLYMILRNFFCGALAMGVIASGRVRRAKRRVLNSNVVTAIYFHNPNKHLFARCVTWLTKNGYAFISVDDGFKELGQNVVPLSRQRKIPITLFIPSKIISGNGLFPWLHQTTNVNGVSGSASAKNGMVRDSITVADVKKIAGYPEVSIGSHTVEHRVTSYLSDEQARFEVIESKRVIESWTGGIIKSFAYPEGRFNGGEGSILAECGYQLAATTEASIITRQSDPYFVPRFHVGDNISFPEAICNMVGVWRPAIDPVIHISRCCGNVIERFRHAFDSQHHTRRGISV
jgi:peptidoglycan/xylan/chitin deacetylase (PgdA/CDA1 family)